MPASRGLRRVARREPRAALASLLVALAACGKSSGGPAVVATAPPTRTTSAEAAVDAAREAEPPEASKEARDAAAKASRTQEELFEDAKQRVDRALADAKEKKPDCGKIVELLDVSFATVLPPMQPDDRQAFASFAACAEREQRWRLLRAVANAMIASDASLKTTYYLPRSLIGLSQYEAAARLSAAALKVWPKEGEAYTIGALASTRIDDWESTKKEADQALLVQRQKGVSDEISAEAHVFKAEALLHLGKIEDSSKELDVAKKVKGADVDAIAKLRERNDVVKSSGLLVEADLPSDVPLSLYPFFAKSHALTGGLVTLRLASFAEKPVSIRVEVGLAGVADALGKTYTIAKGRPQTLRLTPPAGATFKARDLKGTEKHDVSYKITSSDGQVLYEQTKSADVLPLDELPWAIAQRGIDEKLAPELIGIWVTPAAKAVADVLEAAKKRAPGAQFTGTQSPTLPQVKALWDELRERGFGFVRDPLVDAEARRTHTVHMPADVITAEGGHALEGTVLFASLLEAIGLDVLVVRVPGHAFVGWLPSKADRGASDAMAAAVPSPAGTAFFLETTMVTSAPSDAAVLRGAAEFVDAVTKKEFDDGRGTFTRLASVRKLGLSPLPE